MSEHTPGPWSVYDVDPNWRDNATRFEVEGPTYNPVDGGQMIEADARLIAKAPEMYDMLRRLLYEIGHDVDPKGLLPEPPWELVPSYDEATRLVEEIG